MILTEIEIRKLVKLRGHTTPSTYDDAVQEAQIAVVKAEREKPGDKQHAIGRAITAARNYTRKERTYQKHLGGEDFASGLSIHDEDTANLLVAVEDEGFTQAQVRAFYAFLNDQDEDTRLVLTRYLGGENMHQISQQTLISHSQVSRIIQRFKNDAARHIGETE